MMEDEGWREILGRAHTGAREPAETRDAILREASGRAREVDTRGVRVWQTAAGLLFVAGLAAGVAIGKHSSTNAERPVLTASTTVNAEHVVWF